MTDEEDASLKALYQAVAADRPVGGHPSPEELAHEPVTLGVMDHVMTCAACRRDYDLVRATMEAAMEAVGGRPRVRPRWRVPVVAGVGTLVAAALVVALIGRRPVTDVLRGGGDTGAIRLIAPRGNTLVWRAVLGAVGYRVEVDDDSGAVVFQVSTRDTSVSAAGLVRGRRYLWWVRAIAADGTSHASAVLPLDVR